MFLMEWKGSSVSVCDFSLFVLWGFHSNVCDSNMIMILFCIRFYVYANFFFSFVCMFVFKNSFLHVSCLRMCVFRFCVCFLFSLSFCLFVEEAHHWIIDGLPSTLSCPRLTILGFCFFNSVKKVHFLWKYLNDKVIIFY